MPGGLGYTWEREKPLTTVRRRNTGVKNPGLIKKDKY